MKGLIYFAVFAAAQASHLAYQSLHHRPTGCKKYTVQSGDTCASIGQSNGATWAQLLSWNFNINSECSNLSDLTDEDICVSNPSGDYTIPATSPVTTTAIFLNPELNTSCTYLQKYVYYCVQPVGSISTYSGHPGSTTDNFSKVSMTSVPSSESRPDYANPSSQSNSRPVIWLAKDTRKDCYDYLWLPNVTNNALANCWTLANTVGISAEEFILWNASLEKKASTYSSKAVVKRTTSQASASASVATDDYAYPCTIAASLSYCVELSKPTKSRTSSKPASTGYLNGCVDAYIQCLKDKS